MCVLIPFFICHFGLQPNLMTPFKKLYVFIYLAVPGLGGGTQDFLLGDVGSNSLPGIELRPLY